MSKIRAGILLGGALGSFFVTQNLKAYDQHNTHPALTDEAVDFYNLNFPKDLISEKEKQLLIKGAVEEDILPRPVNHFYDPIYQRGWIGYRSSKVWARSSAQQQETRSLLALNPWSLRESSEDWPADFSYERALLDYAKGNRERAFEAFGHVMHLLEDANVPEHTRNDTHIGGHSTGSPYESTMAKWNPGNFEVAKKLFQQRKRPVLLDDLDKYFDAIAGYSNGYFFSEDTIESEKYPGPKVIKFKRFNLPDNKSAFIGVGLDKDNKEFDLIFTGGTKVKRNIIDSKEATLFNKEIKSAVLDGYWDRLSKDFVLHGAGALKMFLEQAEEFKKEYEIRQALKKDNKKSIAGILGLGDKNNGIAMVREFLNTNQDLMSDLFEDPRSDINQIKDRGSTLRILSPKVEPRQTPTKTAEVQPFLSPKVEPRADTPTPSVVPTSIPVVTTTPTPVTTFSSGGGGGNQTAAPTPIPTPEPTSEVEPLEDQGSTSLGVVVINEIAWMGTASSSSDEWIELYNTSSQSVDLTGWSLKAQDGTPSISLAGPISPFGFYLLERTDDTTISDVIKDQIYVGALENEGEILELRDAGNNLQDIVSKSADGWYAGNNSTKSAMERINPLASGSNSANWGTNNGITKNGLDAGGNNIKGTPKSRNSLYVSQKPAKVTDLAVSGSTSLNTVYLTWTVPSDLDTASTSFSFDLRYATKSFDTTSDWDNAKMASGSPFTIQDFNKTYYFAMKTKDNDDNYSDISNQVSYIIPVAVSTSSGWPMSGLNQYHTLKAGFLGPAASSSAIKWGIQSLSSPPYNYGQPLVAPNGTIYLGTTNGTATELRAIASSSSDKWQYVATSGATIGTPVILAHGSIVFGYSSSGINLTKLNSSGISKFENNIGTIGAVMVDKSGISYFTSSGDKLVAVNLDGTTKWTSYKDGVTGLVPTVLDDGKIYLTARVNGVPTFYAFEASNGNFLWSKTMSTSSSSCCGVSDISYDSVNDFFYAGADQYILKLDRSGANLEQLAADRQFGWGYSTTMISQDTDNIIFGLDFSINNPASKSAVYAINRSTKEVAWKYAVDAKINKQISLDSGGNSYFSTQNGWVYSLSQTGGLNWKIDLSGTTSAYPVISPGVLYITLDGARLVKIGE